MNKKPTTLFFALTFISLFSLSSFASSPDSIVQVLNQCHEDASAKISYLLDQGVHIDAIDNETGETPLTFACANGHDEVAHFLLERGANVNTKNVDGETPLCVAAQMGYVSTVSLLLHYNPNVRLANNNNQTPFMLAIENDDDQIANILFYATSFNTQWR